MTTAARLPTRVAIVGGYGVFGSRVAHLLSGDASLQLILAGRDAEQVASAAARLRRTALADVKGARLDASAAAAQDLGRLAPYIVINASGPFQTGTYALAEACIAAGCHYIDLADARGYVAGISALDESARQAGVLVVSGASSVPGLSSAVVEAYAGESDVLTSLDIGISPGNSFDPGLGTVQSVLGGIGAPMTMKLHGAWRTVYGWQGLRRQDFGDAGRRLVGYVDVSDLDLFPVHYPSLETARFQAGLEVSLFHLGLWGLSWLVRGGLVGKPERFAEMLLAAKKRLPFLGSDTGGMVVIMEGRNAAGYPKRLTWRLTAKRGHGPYVPALASAALARRLANGSEQRRGAMACFGLVTLDDFAREAQGFDIHWTCT
jgi:hypothetical protein